MDAVGRRQLVFFVAVVVQAAKLFDWLHVQKSTLAGILMKWALIETALLLLLWTRRVPRLAFTLRATFLLAIAAIIFNLSLFIWIPYGMKHLRIRLTPLASTVELAGLDTETIDDIAGSRQRLIEDIQTQSHLMGSYTVKFRPWSSAKLNEEGRIFCIPHSSPMPNSRGLSESLRFPVDAAKTEKATVLIPITCKGIGPWSVKILLNGKSFRDVHVEAPKLNQAANIVARMEVELDQIGIFSIGQVMDGNGSEGKADGDPVELKHCPQMRFDGLLLQKGVVDMCTKSSFPLKIWLQGQAPFTIALEVIGDNGSEQLILNDVDPDKKDDNSGFRLHKLPIVPGSFKAKASKTFLVRAAFIKDADGRVHQYGTWDLGDSIMFNLFTPPKARWLHNPTLGSLKLLDDGKHVPLSVEVKGVAPFHVTIQSPDGHIIKSNSIIKNHDVVTLVNVPGLYKLLTVEDSLCDGIIEELEELSIQRVTAPTVQVESVPIKGICNGDAGLRFTFLLTGEGPWKLKIHELYRPFKEASSSKSRQNVFTINMPSPRFSYEWKPESPGFFDLDFTHLSDINYELVPLKSNYKYSQEITPAPHAHFIDSPVNRLFTCIGQDLSFQIKLTGIGPWILEYSLTGPEGVAQVFTTNLDQNASTIKLSGLDRPGGYNLVLLSVMDSTDCKASITNESRSISIFSSAPTLSFAEPTVKIREGMNDLVPIRPFFNAPPLQVLLSHRPFSNDDGSEKIPAAATTRMLSINEMKTKGLALDKPGVWTILEIKDNYCKGNVSDEGSSTLIEIISKPKVVIEKPSKPFTCRSKSVFSPVKAILSGNGKITAAYTVQFALEESGIKSALKEKRLIHGLSGEALSLFSGTSNPSPGYYKFEITSVSDSAFPDLPTNGLAISQQILPDPAPRIVPAAQQGHAFCYDSDRKSVGPFSLDVAGYEVTGTFPIKIQYELAKGHKVQSEGEITLEKDKLFFIKGDFAPGSYHLRIVSVESSHGCTWSVSEKASIGSQIKDQSALLIEIVARPSFRISTETLCVGDVAHIELFGTGPWAINYKLNGKSKSDKVSVDRLNVLLAEAGSFKIESLCNKYCCAELNRFQLEYSVHPLPSASITTEGTQFVREGEEAEFAVSLKGTPPFAYSYQRIDDTNGRIIDTMRYDNINSYEHRVQIAAQGTFKLVHVKDKHCQYPKRSEK